MRIQPPFRFSRTIATLAFALIFLAPLSCTKKALPPLAHPKVSALKGVVRYLDSGSNWTRIRIGQELPAGTQLMAGRRGWAVIDLPDGTQLRIDRKARVKITAHNREKVEFHLTSGRLRAWVKKLVKQRFSVKTPNSVCSVRGTQFQVEVTRKGTAIYDLFEGKIHIAHASGEEIVLEPGQRVLTTVSRLGKPRAIPSKVKMRRLPKVDMSGKELRPELPTEGVDEKSVDEMTAPKYKQDWKDKNLPVYKRE